MSMGSRLLINLLLLLLIVRSYSDSCPVCGMDVAGLIEGGSPAPPGRYPYSVSVRFEGLHACGGALVTSGWVLTIKSCAGRRVGFENQVTIVTGTQDCGEELGVSSIVLEEEDGQLALMKLKKESCREPVQRNDKDLGTDDNGLDLTLLGFGRQSGNAAFTERLQEATGLPFQDKIRCLSSHPNLRPVLRTLIDRVICAGVVSRACFGDEGGPLVLPDTSDPPKPASDKLVGLAFFPSGSDKCGEDEPGIFVDVTKSKDWISNTISEMDSSTDE